MYDDVRARAIAVLEGNWSGGASVPSRKLYPHQWSWDSAFIAVGWSHCYWDRAGTELRTLFDAAWDDGRVPHIVFNPDTPENYFPGPEFWQVRAPSGAATTGLVQPPVHAHAVWEIFRHAPDEETGVAFLARMYPRLVAQQRYLAEHRDVAGDGLVAVVHPWETGTDNSPLFDDAMAQVPADPALTARFRRRDVTVVAAPERPTDTDYARFIRLAASYRDGGYRDDVLLANHEFVVADPLFNALYAYAELNLAAMATYVDVDPVPHRERFCRVRAAMLDRLYDAGTGIFTAYDRRAGTRASAVAVNGLIPIVLPGLGKEVTDSLVAHLESERFGVPVPSFDRTDARFDTSRYWRGPAWINIMWLLRHGLRRTGRHRLADRLGRSIVELVDRGGFFEYFDPDTGQGRGGTDFGWTAALLLDVLAEPEQTGELSDL